MKIREIMNQLESRVTFLVDDFKKNYSHIEALNKDDMNVDLENDPRCKMYLDKMIDVFIELKPVERIIRFKYPEYADIFTQLGKIEFERTHGKFFSFLAVLPGSAGKKRGPKPNPMKPLLENKTILETTMTY